MAENNQNQAQDLEEIKQSNPWILKFNLSDAEIIAVINLIGQVIWGDIDLQEYSEKVDKAILKDQQARRQIEIAIAKNRLMAFKDEIDGVEDYIRSLGGTVLEARPPQKEGSSLESLPEIKSDTSGSPSSMAFSMSDEKEIQSIKIPDSGEKTDWSSQAKSIIYRFGLRDSDPIVVKRLENIIIAKLKDVRDDLETSDALTRPRKVGGMEFSDAQADQLLSLIKNPDFSKPKIDQEVLVSSNKLKQPIASPKIEMENGLPVVRLPDDLMVKSELDDLMVKPELLDREELAEELVSQRLKENISSVRINEREGIEESSAKPKIQKEKEGVTEINGFSDKKVVDIPTPTAVPFPAIAPKPEPFLASKRLPSIANIKSSSKPSLDGIKVTKSIMGPIDELESMTLIEFRRLSADPVQAIEKIKEDIETLSKEGFDRRSEAIAAWHRSEVSKFYRLLGQVAMSEGKSVNSVIGERLASGKPTLSMNEFEAIMELNKLIRF